MKWRSVALVSAVCIACSKRHVNGRDTPSNAASVTSMAEMLHRMQQASHLKSFLHFESGVGRPLSRFPLHFRHQPTWRSNPIRASPSPLHFRHQPTWRSNPIRASPSIFVTSQRVAATLVDLGEGVVAEEKAATADSVHPLGDDELVPILKATTNGRRQPPPASRVATTTSADPLPLPVRRRQLSTASSRSLSSSQPPQPNRKSSSLSLSLSGASFSLGTNTPSARSFHMKLPREAFSVHSSLLQQDTCL